MPGAVVAQKMWRSRAAIASGEPGGTALNDLVKQRKTWKKRKTHKKAKKPSEKARERWRRECKNARGEGGGRTKRGAVFAGGPAADEPKKKKQSMFGPTKEGRVA